MTTLKAKTAKSLQMTFSLKLIYSIKHTGQHKKFFSVRQLTRW